MPLDNFDIDKSNDKKAQVSDTALAQFGQSLAYEAHREWAAIGQLVGADVQLPDAPLVAESALGRHAQMFGAATADMLPTLGLALLSRYALGRHLSSDFDSGALEIRSKIGLNAIHPAGIGFITGFLLQPSEGGNADSTSQMLIDRTRRGVTTAATYSLMSGLSVGAELWRENPLGTFAKYCHAPNCYGIVSGGPSGVASAELDSLATTFSFTTDLHKIEQSAYQMALFGGAFGGIGTGVSAIHEHYFTPYASVRRVINSANEQAFTNLKRLKDEGVDFDYVANRTNFSGADAKAFYNQVFKYDISHETMYSLEGLRLCTSRKT